MSFLRVCPDDAAAGDHSEGAQSELPEVAFIQFETQARHPRPREDSTQGLQMVLETLFIVLWGHGGVEGTSGAQMQIIYKHLQVGLEVVHGSMQQ